MNNGITTITHGIVDFFAWFFGDFIRGASDFLFGSSMADGLNLVVTKVNEGLHFVGLDSIGSAVIAVPPIYANNLTIIVSMTLFLGVGVGVFMLLKNLIFNWA